VQAVSTEVETSTPAVSADIDSDEVSTLPMNGRNYQGLAVMIPGVVNQQQGSAMTTGGRSTSSVLSINGLDVSRSFYVLDGVWNENTGNMTRIRSRPNPDSLEEVRVLQNNFSAQYSLLGSSVILMQTKSGTANWHGTRRGSSAQQRSEHKELLLDHCPRPTIRTSSAITWAARCSFQITTTPTGRRPSSSGTSSL
jgi:hypothetical protein